MNQEEIEILEVYRAARVLGVTNKEIKIAIASAIEPYVGKFIQGLTTEEKAAFDRLTPEEQGKRMIDSLSRRRKD